MDNLKYYDSIITDNNIVEKEKLLENDFDFAISVNRIKTKLYHVALLYLQSEALALDAVDEAIYKGLKSIKKLRQIDSFNAWITRILINECKKELRHIKKFKTLDETQEKITDEHSFIPDNLSLKEALNVLPMNLKEVIYLRFFSEYTLSQTAEILGIPQGTVVTWQRKALKILKLELNEEGFDE